MLMLSMYLLGRERSQPDFPRRQCCTGITRTLSGRATSEMQKRLTTSDVMAMVLNRGLYSVDWPFSFSTLQMRCCFRNIQLRKCRLIHQKSLTSSTRSALMSCMMAEQKSVRTWRQRITSGGSRRSLEICINLCTGCARKNTALRSRFATKTKNTRCFRSGRIFCPSTCPSNLRFQSWTLNTSSSIMTGVIACLQSSSESGLERCQLRFVEKYTAHSTRTMLTAVVASKIRLAFLRSFLRSGQPWPHSLRRREESGSHWST
mmetsp:Transcript_46764/g.84438  ORF Transcript_46764/g.84438 Transcript_46764/m.84438 type:complete len:261 (-) Transcript_46764:535-1317(-)